MTIFVFCLSFISFHLMAIDGDNRCVVCVCVLFLQRTIFFSVLASGGFLVLGGSKAINKWMLCLACALFGMLSCSVDENEEPWMQPPWILDWLQKVRLKSICCYFFYLQLCLNRISKWCDGKIFIKHRPNAIASRVFLREWETIHEKENERKTKWTKFHTK